MRIHPSRVRPGRHHLPGRQAPQAFWARVRLISIYITPRSLETRTPVYLTPTHMSALHCGPPSPDPVPPVCSHIHNTPQHTDPASSPIPLLSPLGLALGKERQRAEQAKHMEQYDEQHNQLFPYSFVDMDSSLLASHGTYPRRLCIISSTSRLLVLVLVLFSTRANSSSGVRTCM
jgi:hypothetical protein